MGEWPIVEPVSLGNAIKIKALSIEPSNPRCTISPVRFKLLFVEDFLWKMILNFKQFYKILLMTQWYRWVLIIKKIYKTIECV